MADTTPITVTPAGRVGQVGAGGGTGSVCGDAAELQARRLRHRLLGADLQRHQEEHGAFTGEELTQARSEILAPMGPSDPA